MKVLFWVSKFPTFSETFIRDQIIALIKQKIEILIFSNDKKEDEKNALKGFEKYNLLNKKVDINTYFDNNKLRRATKAIVILLSSIFKGHFKFYKESLKWKKYGYNSKSLRFLFQTNYILKNKITVIHAHFGPNGLDAVPFKKIGLPIKLFTTFHGYDIRLGINDGGRIYNELFKYSDGIFCISEFNYTNLLKFGAKKQILIPITNGVDTLFYKREKPLNIRGKLRILTVARLVEEKELNIAIEAVKKLRIEHPSIDFEYLIVGEGVERERLQRIIDDFQGPNFIKLLGAKNSNQVRDLMISSDLFLLSSKAEALPTVLLEAQSSELVILATDVGAVKSMIKGGVVVPCSNVDVFYKGILELLNKRILWKELSVQGREHILLYHNINIQAHKTIKKYNE